MSETACGMSRGEKRQRAHKNAVDDPITVRYMFEHVDGYQIGERHSEDS